MFPDTVLSLCFVRFGKLVSEVKSRRTLLTKLKVILTQLAKKGFLEMDFELLLTRFVIPVTKKVVIELQSVSILDFSLPIFNQINCSFPIGLAPFKHRFMGIIDSGCCSNCVFEHFLCGLDRVISHYILAGSGYNNIQFRVVLVWSPEWGQT